MMQSCDGVKLNEAGGDEAVTLGVDFTVLRKPDGSIFLLIEQLVTIGDYCFAVLLWNG